MLRSIIEQRAVYYLCMTSLRKLMAMYRVNNQPLPSFSDPCSVDVHYRKATTDRLNPYVPVCIVSLHSIASFYTLNGANCRIPPSRV
jgi:hypothetical protein